MKRNDNIDRRKLNEGFENKPSSENNELMVNEQIPEEYYQRKKKGFYKETTNHILKNQPEKKDLSVGDSSSENKFIEELKHEFEAKEYMNNQFHTGKLLKSKEGKVSDMLNNEHNIKLIDEAGISKGRHSLNEENHSLAKCILKSNFLKPTQASNCKLCKTKNYSLFSKESLIRKYMTSMQSYNVKIINDILSNENTHTVAIFKDFLIYDDTNEFLKRFYSIHESKPRIPKIVDYYDQSTKIFPNYINLPESKFMFKCIEQKQVCIDERQQDLDIAKKKENKLEKFSNFPNKVFTTKFLEKLNSPDSILSSFENSQTLLQSYSKNTKKIAIDTINKTKESLSIQQIIDKLNSKDTIIVENKNTIKEENVKIVPYSPKKNDANGSIKKPMRNMDQVLSINSNVIFRSSKNLSTKNLNCYQENPFNFNQQLININALITRPVYPKFTQTLGNTKAKQKRNLSKEQPLNVNIMIHNNNDHMQKTRNKDKIIYNIKSQKELKNNLIIETNTKIRLKSHEKNRFGKTINLKFDQTNKTPEFLVPKKSTQRRFDNFINKKEKTNPNFISKQERKKAKPFFSINNMNLGWKFPSNSNYKTLKYGIISQKMNMRRLSGPEIGLANHSKGTGKILHSEANKMKRTSA